MDGLNQVSIVLPIQPMFVDALACSVKNNRRNSWKLVRTKFLITCQQSTSFVPSISAVKVEFKRLTWTFRILRVPLTSLNHDGWSKSSVNCTSNTTDVCWCFISCSVKNNRRNSWKLVRTKFISNQLECKQSNEIWKDLHPGCQRGSPENGMDVKRTTPRIPTWSPTVVLTGPEDA